MGFVELIQTQMRDNWARSYNADKSCRLEISMAKARKLKAIENIVDAKINNLCVIFSKTISRNERILKD